VIVAVSVGGFALCSWVFRGTVKKKKEEE